jgi:two-component system response regulator FixJ
MMPDATSAWVDLENTPTVFVVDDDLAFAEWITQLLESIQVEVRYFSDPEEFLEKFDPDCSGCILLDVRLPSMSGLEVQKRLVQNGVQTPVIMITAFGEVSIAVEALQAGAIDFVQKPSRAQSLLDRIQRALEVDRDRRHVTSQVTVIRERLAALSPRESEVLEFLVEGYTTKEIAAKLKIGMTTVDFHRNNLLEKMRVDNAVKLTQMIDHYRQHCDVSRR